MNPKLFPLIAALLFVVKAPATGQTMNGPRISIVRTTNTKDGVQFLVSIENLGTSSIYMEETKEGSRNPYAINIQQLLSDSKWLTVGPRRDVPALSVFELKPGTRLEKTITVANPFIDLRSAPHKRYPISGRHRAVTRYFSSVEDWSGFQRNLRPAPMALESQITEVETSQEPPE